MRDLYYLSDSKLANFSHPQPFLRRVGGEVGLTTPVAVKATVAPGSAPSSAEQLEKVIRRLNGRRKRARDFKDPKVKVGEWISFTDDLVLTVVTDNGLRMAIAAQDGQQFTGDVGLLLFGAAQHVKTRHHVEEVGIRDLNSYTADLRALLRNLAIVDPNADRYQRFSEESAGSLFERVAEREQDVWGPMRGLARVVAVTHDPVNSRTHPIRARPEAMLGPHTPERLVIATPLYLENGML